MKQWIWETDVYIYAFLKVLTGQSGQSFSRIAGEFFLYFPLFAFIFIFLIKRQKKPWFQEILFFTSSGLLSFQISSLLSVMLNRPSPLAIEHRLAGLVGILPVKDAFAFPDWAAASLMALLTFFMIRIGKKNWKMRISVLGLILFFAFCRVNGAFSFFSDVIAGIGIGAIVGFLFAKLLSRVEKQASG